jgi:hypothetical protein
VSNELASQERKLGFAATAIAVPQEALIDYALVQEIGE